LLKKYNLHSIEKL